MITKEQILKANAAGLKHRATGDFWSYYTATLQVAYNLGYEGISLENAETITAFRFGKAPEKFISWNYSESKSENGLSVYTEKSIVRSEFLDRAKFEYTGIVSGTGSDGEVVILCFEADYLD
jgi:hypothetical protein